MHNLYISIVLIVIILLFLYSKWIFGYLVSLGSSKKRHYFFNDFQRNTLFGLRTSDGWINIVNPFRSVFIAGGAGSGKSESLIKPIILESVRQDYCGILYDFKDPELSTYLYTALAQKEKSPVTFKRISFSDLASSARCNPLAPRYLHTLSHAEEYATVIINNLVPESITKMDFWNRSAIALLQSTIWYFKENRPQECDLPHIVAFLQSSHHDVIKTLMQDETCKRLISSIVTAYEQNAEGQLAGSISTLQLALNKINTPEIAYLLGRDEVNLDINNPNEPTFLAIGNDPNIQGSISPVISLIITVSLRMMNKADKHHSVVILDEAPTLYIPNFESIPATARSNKISIVFCCQDLSQVIDRYGKGKKDILLSNLAYQFWGRVSHFETSQYMIQLAGKDDVIMETYSSSSSSSTNSSTSSNSVSQSKQLRDNLKIQHIQNFAPGNFLCVLVER
jgi:type IV secretory pathway TraG/TraD family ATPase VirD4